MGTVHNIVSKDELRRCEAMMQELAESLGLDIAHPVDRSIVADLVMQRFGWAE